MAEAKFTIGVEEEYQLVERETGALVGRAPALVDGDGPARQEYQQTMIEVSTPVCTSAEEACRRLGETRAAAARLAREGGLAVAAAGLHPVGPYPRSQLSDVAAYHGIAATGGTPARELHIFGMHVHVAVPDAESAIRAMGGAAYYLPHLLALSASSPFHRGEDTRFESYRTVLRDTSPRTGLPMPVAAAGEFERLVRILVTEEESRAGESPISWDVRPSARYPTLEYRLLDCCPSLERVAFLVALARALTVMFVDRPAPQPTGLELQLMRDNRWRAARFGLDARFFRLDPPTGEQQSARDMVRALVDRLGPIAERLGDGAILAGVERHLERGTAAARMREVYQATGSFPAVTQWVVEHTDVPGPAGA